MTLTRPDLVARIVGYIRDNLRGEINAQKVRIVLTDIADSFPNLLSDRISLSMLAEDVLAVLGGGLDPTKFQGVWDASTDTPTIPMPAVGNNGHWYLINTGGTAAGNAAGTYASGDRVRSNGTAWVKLPAPPTVIADGAVNWEKLSAELRQLLTPSFSQEFVYALVDINNRVAFGVRPDGSLYGKLPLEDGAVTTQKIAAGAVTLAKLASAVTSLLPADLGDHPEFAYAIVDSQNRIALGIKHDGTLVGRLPIADAAISTPKLADGAVTLAKLDTPVAEVIPQDIGERIDYAYLIVDSENRIAFAIRKDGTLVGKLPLIDGSVTLTKLGADVQQVLPVVMDDGPGWAFVLVDQNNRMGFGIRQDGTLVGKFPLPDGSVTTPKLAAQSVTLPKLAQEVSRVITPVVGDRVTVDHDDDGWRGRTFEIPVTTEYAGSLFAPFASCPTRSIRGVNGTGVALEFRRSNGLVIRGKLYRGTWTPASGAPNAAPDPGDWWNVTASGSFAGLSWVNGDRIVALANVPAQGPQWAKVLPGELCYLGEFTPASHAPADIRDGDLWQAAASGTFSGLAFSENDLLIRESGAWGRIPTNPVTVVANGQVFSFAVANARDIEVRRQDKLWNRVSVLAKGLRTVKTRRSRDGIVMWGDSMVATGGLNSAIAGFVAPRTFTGISYPGAQSHQILAMIQKEVRGADSYRGWLHAFFHGTNNLNDAAQVRASALAMADLAGARDNRIVWLSVIGQLVVTWNGSRFEAIQHESAFQRWGGIWELEQWYEAAFPGALLNCRQALIDGAPTIPSLQFPGLTEAQAATTYGVLPLSFFMNMATKPWSPSALTFRGYWSSAGLPSGGTDGDYWLRTGNGFVGSVLVRWGGTWTEHTYDVTHLTPAGNAVLAQAFADFLTDNSL